MRYGYIVAVVAAESQEGSQFEVLGAQAGQSGNRNSGFFSSSLENNPTVSVQNLGSNYEPNWSFDPFKSPHQMKISTTYSIKFRT